MSVSVQPFGATVKRAWNLKGSAAAETTSAHSGTARIIVSGRMNTGAIEVPEKIRDFCEFVKKETKEARSIGNGNVGRRKRPAAEAKKMPVKFLDLIA